MTDSALFGRPQRDAADHLSTHQLEHLRELLGTQLLVERRRTDQALAALSNYSASYTHEDRDLAHVVVERGTEYVSLLEWALERMALGSYGFCEGCKRPIPFDWLSVIPEARHCVGCMRIG